MRALTRLHALNHRAEPGRNGALTRPFAIRVPVRLPQRPQGAAPAAFAREAFPLALSPRSPAGDGVCPLPQSSPSLPRGGGIAQQ